MNVCIATLEALFVKTAQGLASYIVSGTALICLLIGGCRPAVAPVEIAPPLVDPIETHLKEPVESQAAAVHVQEERPEPSTAKQPSEGVRALLRQLEQRKVDCTEVDGGYAVGIASSHVTEDGKIQDEVIELLQQIPRVVSLNFFRADVSDAGFEQVKTFRELKRFSSDSAGLHGKFTDEGVAHLGDLTNLEELNLFSASNMTDAALPVIAKLTNLRELYISDSQVTDVGLMRLAPLKRLEKLELVNCEYFEGRGLAFLNGLPSLRALNLHGCNVTDAGLSTIQKLPNLGLFVANYNERLTGVGLGFLSGSPELRVLSVYNCPELGDAAILAVSKCRELERLVLSGSAVTDKGVQSLERLANLQTLDLDNCQKLTDDSLPTIGGLRSLHELTLSRTQVTDVGLRHLHGLSGLKSLLLQRTKVTAAGAAALRRHLPAVEIYQE